MPGSPLSRPVALPARRCIRTHPHGPALDARLTGYDEDVSLREGGLGATERLLIKPFTPGQLIEAVATLARDAANFSGTPS